MRSSTKGDLLCRVIVETPVKLDRNQKELLHQFEQSMLSQGTKNSPQANSWMDGVKRFFDFQKTKVWRFYSKCMPQSIIIS